MIPSLNTLVVDDEKNIRLFLTETLERAGHRVTTATSGETALEILRDSGFDLAILDLRLGGGVDGQRLLEAIRWRWPSTVVIFLTAHGTLTSAVKAIQEGVDGYLLKPVRPEDVRQAVEEAFQRRHSLVETERSGRMEPSNQLERGPFKIDLTRHEATFNGDSLDLSPSEYNLLVFLMQKSPQVVDPKTLVKEVRGYKPDTEREARDIIKWYIHRLRQAIEPDPANPRYVINVRGVGYRFEAQD